jgi:hypothetical protein
MTHGRATHIPGRLAGRLMKPGPKMGRAIAAAARGHGTTRPATDLARSAVADA